MTSMDDFYNRLNEMPARFAAAIAEQQAIERAREQERFRTVKPFRWISPQIATPGPNLVIGNPPIIDEGYAADVRVIAATLSAADTLAAFTGENSLGYPLGAPAASGVTGLNIAVILIPKSSGVLFGGEAVFLQTGGTGNIVRVRISGWQAAGPEIAKLF